ncbi:MAG: division/cell wall cluster transcriptional repressor MraZ [Candidatus Binatia bacterium]
MFRGSFDHVIDQKGRVSVPARFRELILASGSNQIFITRFLIDSSRCLDAYPAAAWERFEEEFKKQKRFDRSVILFENFYQGNAQVCEVDAQGRILIPPSLREWAHITKEVVFSGARDKFRIWDRSAWSHTQTEAEAALHTPEFLSKIDL